MTRGKKYKKDIGVLESLRVVRANVSWQDSSCVFWAENSLEAGAGELNANQMFPLRGSIDDVDDAARSGKIGFAAARRVVRERNPDFEVGADGDVETRDEGGAAAAQIFAGSFFFEDNTAAIAASNFERQADCDSTLRALLRSGLRQVDHGRGPLFWRSPRGHHSGQPQSDHYFGQLENG